MATSDGLHTGNPQSGGALTSHLIQADSIGDITATGDLTLTAQYRRYLRIDPGGAARNVDLPAEATSNGLSFEILNTADAAEALTVRDDAGATVVTIAQNEKATVHCDGTSWYHMGISTIALS